MAMKTGALIATGVMCSVLLSACAGTAPVTDQTVVASTPARYASALAYPDRLAPVGGDSTALRWVDPAIDLRKFNKILIERIRVQLDGQSSPVDPNDLKALTDYFQGSLARALQPPYTLVDTSGPDVLRVRITIVDLVATKPDMSVVVLLTPYATLPDLMSSAATGRPAGSAPYLGQTGIAAEFVDGGTNRVVAEYAETRFGRKYVLDTNQGTSAAVSKGVTNYLDAYSTWAYAKQAFDAWSQQFRQRLDQIDGRSAT